MTIAGSFGITAAFRPTKCMVCKILTTSSDHNFQIKFITAQPKVRFIKFKRNYWYWLAVDNIEQLWNFKLSFHSWFFMQNSHSFKIACISVKYAQQLNRKENVNFMFGFHPTDRYHDGTVNMFKRLHGFCHCTSWPSTWKV